MSREKTRNEENTGQAEEKGRNVSTRNWDPVGCSWVPFVSAALSGAPRILLAPALCSWPYSLPILHIHWGLPTCQQLPNLYLLPWFLLCLLASASNHFPDVPFWFPRRTFKSACSKTNLSSSPKSASTWLLESETRILPLPITPHPIGEGRIMALPKKSTF